MEDEKIRERRKPAAASLGLSGPATPLDRFPRVPIKHLALALAKDPTPCLPYKLHIMPP